MLLEDVEKCKCKKEIDQFKQLSSEKYVLLNDKCDEENLCFLISCTGTFTLLH